MLEAHAVHASIAAHGDQQPVGQRIDHRHADTMQTAGETVIVAAELAACVQSREDQLDATDAIFRVDVHRHATAVVLHLDRAVGEQGDADARCMAGQRLVDAVVDHFLNELVGARGIGVHARSLAYRVEACQDLYGFGGILFGHAAGIVPCECCG